MRITKNSIKNRVDTLNMMFERPMALFTPGSPKANTGHLSLDINSTGFRLVEQLDTGGERNWSGRLSGKDMDIFIDGIVRGIALRNEHIGRVLFKATAEQPTTEDVANEDDCIVAPVSQLLVEPCDHSFAFTRPMYHANADVYTYTKCGVTETKNW